MARLAVLSCSLMSNHKSSLGLSPLALACQGGAGPLHRRVHNPPKLTRWESDNSSGKPEVTSHHHERVSHEILSLSSSGFGE